MIALTVEVASYAGALFSSRILLKMSATVYRKGRISIVHSCSVRIYKVNGGNSIIGVIL